MIFIAATIAAALFFFLRKGQHMKYLPKIGWVYCLWAPSYPYMCKVGYSAKPDFRRSAIKQTIEAETGRRVTMYTVMMMPMLRAKSYEKAIHGSRVWASVSGMPGSGHTEWTWCVNVFSAFVTLLVMWILGDSRGPYLSMIVALLPVPIDFCIFVAIFGVAQLAAAGWLIAFIFQNF